MKYVSQTVFGKHTAEIEGDKLAIRDSGESLVAFIYLDSLYDLLVADFPLDKSSPSLVRRYYSLKLGHEAGVVFMQALVGHKTGEPIE